MVTSNAAVRRGSLVEPQLPVGKVWQNRLQDHQKHNKADYELCDLWDRSWQAQAVPGTEPADQHPYSLEAHERVGVACPGVAPLKPAGKL
jgi:hypothetical protein